jgi:hypothetical protein
VRMRILKQIRHPHHLILVVPGLPFVVALLLVLLLLLLLQLLLLLGVMSSTASSYRKLFSSEKVRCKEVSNFILEKWYENEKVTLSH